MMKTKFLIIKSSSVTKSVALTHKTIYACGFPSNIRENIFSCKFVEFKQLHVFEH